MKVKELYIQIFDKYIDIFINCNHKQAIESVVKDKSASKGYKDFIKNTYFETHFNNKKCKGAVITDKEKGYTAVILHNMKNDWDSMDALNHEVAHLVDYLFENRKIENEMEFRAYLHQSLFRDIRRLINKKEDWLSTGKLSPKSKLDI